MSELDAIFAALGDPTRRAVLQRLVHGPATAGQLAALASMSRPAVSQHARVLREAQLIRPIRSGRNVWYEIAGTALVETQRWLDRLVEHWSQAPTWTELRSAERGKAAR